MFERIGRLAERVATDVSRRHFLSRLGSAAMAAAGVGGLLALPSVAQAGKPMCSATYSCMACIGRPVGATCGDKGMCKKTGLINGEIACCCDESGKPPSDH